VLLGWFWLDWTALPLLKFTVIALASLALSLAGALAVAETAPTRLFFGLRRNPRRQGPRERSPKPAEA
jgi:hypothetical protein